MIISDLTGTGVALATPFDGQNGVDFAALKKLVQHVVNGGADYLVALGTTAETPTLAPQEKDEIVAAIKEHSAGLPVVIGLGGNNTAEVVRTIERSNFDGIAAMLSVTPYYNRPSQQGLYEHFNILAQASPVPIVLYNVPSRTGINLLPDTILKLALLPNIVAVKEASGSIAQASAILADKPSDFLVLSGDDGLAVPFLSLGARGLISVAANAFPRQISAMVRAALSSDFPAAARIQLQMLPLIDACFSQGNPAGIKAALSVLGIADSRVRLPLAAASAMLIQKMEINIKTISGGQTH